MSSPAGVGAALAVVDLLCLDAGELDAFIRTVGVVRTDVGSVSLADVAGVDRAVCVRWSPGFAQVTPHGGVAVVRALMRELVAHGAEVDEEPSAEEAYPEARSVVEARALAALGRAVSPLAVDVLLAQHERWLADGRDLESAQTARDVRLMRLIEPALVVVVGPANVGKSTLLNTLAGRELALVADVPGTTRDHVGAWVDLGGLVVRWVDTPGVREASGVEAEAIGVATRLAAGADLLIGVGDSGSGDPRGIAGRGADVVVALRADLGLPGWGHDLAVSARTGVGVAELVGLVRERLVPGAEIGSAEPWRFWG